MPFISSSTSHRADGSDRAKTAATEYEFRMLVIGRDQPRGQTRAMLAEEAEYGRWELARSVLYVDGERRVWLRRKIIRVRSTL